MNIKQFRYLSDNLAYLVYNNKTAVAIDGGAVDLILSFVKKNGLKLKFVTNTHAHSDHTSGLKSLLDRSGALYLDGDDLLETGYIELEGERLNVIHTPGHTNDSVTFYGDNILITGDTLFNGTIGNCFTGDNLLFLNSIKKLMKFSEKTVIYAGHDYFEYAMEFARVIEPENDNINAFLKKYNPLLITSTLEDEFKANPYLRFNNPQLMSALKEKGFSVSTEQERWEALMSFE
ncbi:MAG: hydroxyacylglutathione hydrolase [Proteobacteria bacterium]|nr:hydroxyacylglutathione hydrolase [Pseudomonadota bacterium]